MENHFVGLWIQSTMCILCPFQGCKSGFYVGGIIGQILPKFAISRVCKHKLILGSTQFVKFSIPTMFTKQLLQIQHNKVIILTILSIILITTYKATVFLKQVSKFTNITYLVTITALASATGEKDTPRRRGRSPPTP